MNRVLILGIACIGIGLSGCKNTAEGFKEDTTQNAESAKESGEKASVATRKATERLGSATEKMGKNAGDALTLTPKIKKAITDDKTLNNTANLIDVKSGNNEVRLTGHVLTEEMKALAGEIAQKTITDAGSKNALINELKVKP
ncbi:BON domain-containing protein [Armatimonas sp.]|uniref:BON domain-containing protein n=1 Tax=Armatimonas sp. TaxID=1872638 RepID=UPI00286B051C|nr:BON domain-containing protein [Armatimonas sp.]